MSLIATYSLYVVVKVSCVVSATALSLVLNLPIPSLVCADARDKAQGWG